MVTILNSKFSRDADVLLRFWGWSLVDILKMNFDQYLCLNLWYELNPRVRCAFGNVSKVCLLYCEGGPAPPRKRQFKVTAKVLTSALQNCPRLRIAKDFVFCLDSINEMRNYKLFWLKLTMLRRTFSWSGNYQVECWAITVKQTIYRQVPIASFS